MFGKMVANKRAELGISYRSAAKICGVSDALLVSVEKYGHIPKHDTCQKIINGLKIDKKLAWKKISTQMTPNSALRNLLDGQGLIPVPVITSVRSGKIESPHLLQSNFAESTGFDIEYLPAYENSKIYGLYVDGNEMEPEFQNGDRIFANPDVEIKDRKLAVVGLKNGSVSLKRYTRQKDDIILESVMGYEPIQIVPAEEVYFVHPVVYHLYS